MTKTQLSLYTASLALSVRVFSRPTLCGGKSLVGCSFEFLEKGSFSKLYIDWICEAITQLHRHLHQDPKLWPFHGASVLWLVAACRVDLPSAEEKGGTETTECKGREREHVKLKTPYLSRIGEDHGAHFRPVWEPGCSFFWVLVHLVPLAAKIIKRSTSQRSKHILWQGAQSEMSLACMHT